MARTRRPTNFGQQAQDISEDETYYYKWMKKIQQLVLNRINWVGLPDTCDERWLERVLTREGKAVFFNMNESEDKNDPDLPPIFMATKFMGQGPMDQYDNQHRGKALGSGFSKQLLDDQFVVIWNSTTRLRDWGVLEQFARDLAAIDIAQEVNRRQQKWGVILTGREGSFNDTMKIREQIDRGDVVIVGLPDLKDNIEVTKLDLSVPYLQDKFHEDKLALWQEVCDYLGILTVDPTKSQYSNYGELEIVNDHTARVREDLLFPRRQACEAINEMWGDMLEEEIKVEWRTDVFETMSPKPANDPGGEQR